MEKLPKDANFPSVEIEKENPKHHRKVQAVVAESIWASKLLEAVPYCERFIHSFEELMPRGLGS